MNDKAPDLHTLTFDELCDELAVRCDALILGAMLKTPATTEDGTNLRTAWYGTRLTTRGLLADMDDMVRHASRGPIGIAGKDRR